MFGVLRRFGSLVLKVLVVTGSLVAPSVTANNNNNNKYQPVGIPDNLPRIRTCTEKQPADAATTSTTTTTTAVFSPYVECWTSQDLRKIPGTSVTLAFLLSRNGQASWDGTMPLDAWRERARASGKKIVLSFGGASGTELALAVTDVKALAKQYVEAAKRYEAWKIDLDIEGSAVGDKASVARRNTALLAVQATLPAVKLQYTLPVMPFGLDAACLALLRDAKTRGVRLDAVNVMAMDYGPSYAGDMGQYAVQAAQATRRQLDDLGLKGVGIGITPMILQNDVENEVFTLKHAKRVADFAAQTPWVRFVGYWASGRDPGYEFAKVFANKLQ